VYLGFMLPPTLLESGLIGGLLGRAGPYANSLTMLLTAAVYFTVAQLLSSKFLTDTFCISFPRWIDNIGGFVFGFIGGYMLTNIILFALAASPLKSDSLTSKFIPANKGHTIISVCEFVSSFSLQYGDKNIQKAADKIFCPPVLVNNQKPKPKDVNPSDSNQIAPVVQPVQMIETTQYAASQPEPNQIPEPNQPQITQYAQAEGNQPPIMLQEPNQPDKQEPNLAPEPNSSLNMNKSKLRGLQMPQGAEKRFIRK